MAMIRHKLQVSERVDDGQKPGYRTVKCGTLYFDNAGTMQRASEALEMSDMHVRASIDVRLGHGWVEFPHATSVSDVVRELESVAQSLDDSQRKKAA